MRFYLLSHQRAEQRLPGTKRTQLKSIYIYKYGHIERCKPAEREQSRGSRGRVAGWLSLDFAHHHLAVGIRHFAAAVEAAKLLQKAHAGKKKTQRTARP